MKVEDLLVMSSINMTVSSALSSCTGVVWFKNDLRMRDNIALSTAHKECSRVAHVYVIDPVNFRLSTTNSAKFSLKRVRFLAETLVDLHQSLVERGSALRIMVGPTEKSLPKVASELIGCNLYYHDEYVYEERQLMHKTLDALKSSCDRICPFWGGATLYEPEELPFSVAELGLFTPFRLAVQSIPIKAPLLEPELLKTDPKITLPDDNSCITLPEDKITVSHIVDVIRGVAESEICASMKDNLYLSGSTESPLYTGGESSGWARIEYYILAGLDRLSCYKETRNGMIGMDFSSKLSCWLSSGSITARQVAQAVFQFEEASGISNESTRFLIFELLWRDYMKFYALRWEVRLFTLGGPQGEIGRQKHPWGSDESLIHAWKNGSGYIYLNH